MQNETLETDVRNAVEQGHDVQEAVRQLTLRKISSRSLDIESLRQIARSVVRGARAGVQKDLNLSAAQTETARVQLKQAVAGLDAALAQLAEASKLAIEEATTRAQKFSDEDLSRARADFESLETIFLETLQESVTDAKDAAGEILHNIAEHSRTHGSAVGEKIGETLAVITHQLSAAGHAQAVAALHLTQATTDLLRQIAAGVLTGLADHVRPGQAKDKED
jgi:undecaprenyl pyrophosphate synthase